jgi:hypothetical protein
LLQIIKIEDCFLLLSCCLEELGKHAGLTQHDISPILVSSHPHHLNEDHALWDDLDVEQLTTILDTKDLDVIRDNKTDDDHPDLETDDSSGGELQQQQQLPSLLLETSVDAITEATDITTPLEMLVRDLTTVTAETDHTSAQVSELSEIVHEEETKMALLSSDGHHPVPETLCDITDPEEEEEDDNNMIHASVISAGESTSLVSMPHLPGLEKLDNTFVTDKGNILNNVTPCLVQLRIQKRQHQIDEKFKRISQEITLESVCSSSLDSCNGNEQEEEFHRVAAQLTDGEEEAALLTFDQLVLDTFLEDKSEDWKISNEVTPDIEATDILFDEVNALEQGEREFCRIFNIQVVN